MSEPPVRAQASAHPFERGAVLAVFLVSGWAGLGYQVLWSKYLLLAIGVSAYSYAAVLAAFMGGLALGSWAFGRLADSVRSPLSLYAYLELGVGVYAVLYPGLNGWLTGVLHGRLAGAEGGGLWLRALAAGLLLLPPTVAMGGTLPAMVRHASESLRLAGRRVPQLYGVNALGAVLGSLSMAFLLLPALGMRSSLLVLALTNALLAAAALMLARRGSARGWFPPEAGSEGGSGGEGRVPALGGGAVWLVLGTAFAAGFACFTLEIGWTRFFAILLGSSTYSFAIMLAAFISGITVGSLLLVRLDRRVSRPLRLFGWSQLVAGMLVGLSVPLYPWLELANAGLGRLFSRELAAFYLHAVGKLLLCYLVMLPPTVLLGMAIPLLVRALAQQLGVLGRDTGRVYAWNTVGNVLGALLAGLVLLEWLGLETLLRTAAVVSVGVGSVALALEARAGGTTGRRPAFTCVVASLVLVAAWALTGRWDLRLLTGQGFRSEAVAPKPGQVLERAARVRLLLTRDDPAGSIMVGWSPEREPQLALWINGKVDATSRGDYPTQVLAAHLPLLLHPEPRSVLVVGLASGITAGAALTHGIERLDVVEIIAAMPEATRLFAETNRDPLADPRFRLVIDDARSLVARVAGGYDVIISEPSNPWLAGVSSLFTTEFYRSVKGALRPGGLLVQWVQAYEIGDDTLALMVRTLRREFPHVRVFQGTSSDLLLLASLEPLGAGVPLARARLQDTEAGRQLAGVGLHGLAEVLFLERLSPGSVDLIAALGDEENTDDNQRLEHRAPLDLYRGLRPTLLDRLDERNHMAPSLLWHRLRRGVRGVAAPPIPFALFNDPRFAVDGVIAVLRDAQHAGLGPADGEGGGGLGLPSSWLGRPPLPVPELVARVEQLLAAGRADLAAQVLEERRGLVVFEVALDPVGPQRWLPLLARWVAAAAGGPPADVFRRLRIDALAASGDLNGAADELRHWVASPEPPEWEWGVSRACQLDRVGLGREVVARYQRRFPTAAGDRLVGLLEGLASIEGGR